MSRGYYTNGLKKRMKDLVRERDLLAARYRRMERMKHPSEALTAVELQQRAALSSGDAR